MAQYVFTMNRVGKIVPPKRQILKDISLSFFPGAKIGLLGLNGSGKSTLIRIMAGVDKDIEGEATPMPNLNIGYLPQEPQLDPNKTVRETVEEGLGDVFNAQKKLDEIYAAYAEPDADFDALAAEQAKYEAILATTDGGSAEQQIEIAADALRLPAWDAKIEHLSGGEKRRVALCKLLLEKPDMLLLDEPTNHLDAESVDWLEQFLTRFPGTVVAVTHDRYFLDNAAEWILELDRGHGIPWKGNYSSWLDQKEERLKQEEASESARQKAIKKELEWVRQNPKGRQAKSKARIARFEELNSQDYQKRNETQEIFIPVGDRLGNEVIEFKNVSKSYGDRLLLEKPDMLLLDEPTNHLDAESVEWLEQFLTRFPGTVVAVTHDRYFLDNAAEWILELDRGHGIPWKGNYSSWLDQKENRLKQEEASESARQKAIKKELEWVRQNPKGRQAKSKARIARFEELSSQDYQKRNETSEIFIPVGDRLGNEVIEFKNVSKAYGDRLLIDNLSFKVPAGAIVGIIGPNGAGKSTLFRMLTGRETPDSGEVVMGPTVKLAYVDQSRDALNGSKTVFEEISGGADVLTVGKYETPSRAYIGRFNFKGSDQQKNVGNLSGGERGRLHLAKTLIAGGNMLLLDEPSNDLDVETLRALEDALLEFAGSVMVISHDRWFLDRIATHILAFEGDSQVVFFDGNYQEYEADKRKRLGEEAAKPKRIRYKPITR